MPMAHTFDQQVRDIIKPRQQNSAMMVRHRWTLDPIAVGDELERYTRLRCGWPMSAPPSPAPSIPGIGPMTVNAVSDIKRLASGAGMLMAWNDGGDPPVYTATAETRAQTCVVCPRNSQGKLSEWLGVPVAAALKNRLARLTALNLKTSADVRLGLCEACSVPTSTLVHEPSAIIERKLKPEYRSDLDPKCWIIKP